MDQNMVLGPVLSLKFTEEKGLELNWNLKGVLHSQYETAHVFILGHLNYQSGAKLLSHYYEGVKPGDLLAISKLRSPNKPHLDSSTASRLKWIEKCGNSLPDTFLKESHFTKTDLQKTIYSTMSSLQGHRGLIMLNVVLPEESAKDREKQLISSLTKKIKQIRDIEPKTDNILVNFLTSCLAHTQVDGISGVNTFFYNQFNSLTTCREIRCYMRSLSMESVRIKIQFGGSKYMGVSSIRDWKIKDFNIIEKKYYGVPSLAFTENMVFMYQDQNAEININLKFSLFFTLYNGVEVRDQKSLHLKGSLTKIYQQTIVNESRDDFNWVQLNKNTSILTSYCKKNHYICLNSSRKGIE